MLPDYMKIKDIKPALSGYIGESLALLNPDIEPGEKVVHDVRVFMKKSRAVMKLLKNQIEESTFEREYKTFRETGRIMREWRETSVLRKILKLLRKKHPDIFTGRTYGFHNTDLFYALGYSQHHHIHNTYSSNGERNRTYASKPIFQN